MFPLCYCVFAFVVFSSFLFQFVAVFTYLSLWFALSGPPYKSDTQIGLIIYKLFLYRISCLYTLSHYTVLSFMIYTSVVRYLTTYVWNKSFIHSSQLPLRLYKACRFARPSSKWLASGCQFATTSKCCIYFCRQRLKLCRLPGPQHAASFHVLQVLLTLRQWRKVNDPETHVQSL